MNPVYPTAPYNSLTFRATQSTWPYGMSGSLSTPLPAVAGLTDPNTQSFRIIRRVPTESYILVRNRPVGFSGEGLLLPENFDRKYNARQVAIDLNIIRAT